MLEIFILENFKLKYFHYLVNFKLYRRNSELFLDYSSRIEKTEIQRKHKKDLKYL